MAVVLPVELQAMNAELNRSISQVTASIQNLDDQINKFNKTVQNVEIEGAFKKQSQAVEQSNRSFLKFLGDVVAGGLIFGGLAKSVKFLGDQFFDATDASEGLKRGLRDGTTIARQAAHDFNNAAKQTELFQKGIFGTISRIATFGTALTGLGLILERSDNQIISFIGSLTTFVGLLTGPVALAFTRIISAAGSFIRGVGDDLVSANQAAAASFQAADLQSFTYSRTLNNLAELYPEVISGTLSWDKAIKDINTTTGTNINRLQVAATEIAATTTEIGLNEKQMIGLLNITNDYSRLLKEDVVDVTLNFISALNGNSQAVQKYGIQLTESSINQKLLSNGINATISNMTEQEKVQTRLAAITKSFTKLEGLAAAQTTTFAGTVALLESRQRDLAIQFGEGANVIESFNIGQRLLLTTIDLLSPTIVKVTGFFSALFGRLLQGIGIILEVIFLVTLLTTSFRALNTFLASKTFETFFTATIPLANRSLKDMVTLLGVTNVSIKSLGDVFKTFGAIVVAQSKNLIGFLLGIEASAVSLSVVMSGLAARIALVGRAFLALTINPIFLTIVALVTAITTIVNAFQALEQRTKAVSLVFGAFSSIIGKVFDALLKPLGGLEGVFDKIGLFFERLFGRLVSGFAFLSEKIISLLLKLPNSFLAVDQKLELKNAQESLRQLQANLSSANFQISSIANTAIASKGKLADFFSPKGIDEFPKKVQALAKELASAGLTELENLKRVREERIKLVEENVRNEEQRAFLLLKIDQDFAKKRIELERKNREELLSIGESVGGVAVLEQRLAERLEKVRMARDQELLTEQEFLLAKENLEIEFINRRIENQIKQENLRNGLNKKSKLEQLEFERKIIDEQLKNEKLSAQQRDILARRRAEVDKQVVTERLNIASDFFGNLSSLTRTGNAQLFAIGKAAAIAQATIDGFLAIQKALSAAPPPLNFALAASVGIRTAANIAAISAQGLQRGLTSVPAGFPGDSFPAALTSGERVVSAPQNQDLTRFLDKENKDESGNDAIVQRLDNVVTAIQGLNSRLDNLENEIVVNIGTKEIVREVRDGLRAGRRLVG